MRSVRSGILTSTVIAMAIVAGVQWWISQPDAEEIRRPVAAIRPMSTSATAPQQGATALLIPVVGVRPGQLADTFTQARAGGAHPHDAIDIPAPRGTPVVAAAAGRVEKLFLSKAGGRTVYVRSPDGGTLYYYAHLDSYADGLTEGTLVRRGALLGAVGATGNADPAVPHLHFAIWRTTPERKWWQQAPALNPYPLLVRSR